MNNPPNTPEQAARNPLTQMTALKNSDAFTWYLGRIEKRASELQRAVLHEDSLTYEQRECRRYCLKQFRDLLDNEFTNIEREEAAKNKGKTRSV